MSDKFVLDELDVDKNLYAGFIKKVVLLDEKHLPGIDTINSIQLSQSLKEIFISILNGLYLMKEGQPVVYVNLLNKCIQVTLDKYGVPDKTDIVKLYEPFNNIFKSAANGVFVPDLQAMWDEIYSGNFVYEE